MLNEHSCVNCVFCDIALTFRRIKKRIRNQKIHIKKAKIIKLNFYKKKVLLEINREGLQ